MKLAVIDYGVGNLRSIQRGFQKVGGNTIVTCNEVDIRTADAIVLPGVGAFSDAIKNIKPLSQAVLDQVDSGKPLLGICLGLQLLFTESTEEGLHRGLDVIKGKVVRLPPPLKVPQMGWNTLNIVRLGSPLYEDVPNNSYAYFAHSYYGEPENEGDIVTTTEYGTLSFASSVARGHVFGTQFHPEKSGATGSRILRNFLGLVKR